MALAKNVMGGGHLSAITAQAINGNNVNSAVTAAGTTLGTATTLTADVNVVTTASVGQGVAVYNGMIGDSQIIYNGTNVQILVYPPIATAQINQLAVGVAFVLAPYTAAEVVSITATKDVAFLSA